MMKKNLAQKANGRNTSQKHECKTRVGDIYWCGKIVPYIDGIDTRALQNIGGTPSSVISSHGQKAQTGTRHYSYQQRQP